MKHINCKIKGSLIYIFLFISAYAFSQDSLRIPLSKLFYRIDRNFIGSFTYNYGLNELLAASFSYGIVKSGIDWKWNRLAVDNSWIPTVGMPAAIVGGLVPLAAPLGLYLYGHSHENENLQITGLALGQAAMLGLAISTGIKALTGRRPPGILGSTRDDNDYSGDFRFGFLQRGAFNGWPSSHTTIAFAMAVTLIELYPDNTTLKIGALAYASLIGLGVSTNIHWLSDAVAGTLIGYAIGKTVGKSFRSLMNQTNKQQVYQFYATPVSIGFSYNF